MNPPIRVVCFDLGGVVIRICRSWAEGCRVVGLDVRGDVDSVITSTGAWDDLNDAYQRGEIVEGEFTERFSDMVAGLYSPEEIALVHRAWTLGAYPRIETVLDRIHELGVETAVLSNTCHEHWETLVELPTLRAIRHLFASHLLAARKPEAAAYHAVEAGTGHAGAAVLFFDDLPENVEGARGIGWHAECIDPLGCTATQIEEALARYGVFGVG